MAEVEVFDIENHRKCMLDISNPISSRTQSAFYLRTNGTPEALDVLMTALKIREDSALMRHELAYILGQMRNPAACDVLCKILEDESDDLLVRHESAEALGAIGDRRCLDTLNQFAKHPLPEISETCIIALDLFEYRLKAAAATNDDDDTAKGMKPSHHYLSVDPAPPSSSNLTVSQLQHNLMDTSSSLFERYRAMFALRNMNNDDAALALVTGLKDTSALFRHEIAYVLGQMERSVAIEGLSALLIDSNEHRMVRHECAESLGNIGGPEVTEVLRRFETDSEGVVKESCVVALDAMEYWANFSNANKKGDEEAATAAISHY